MRYLRDVFGLTAIYFCLDVLLVYFSFTLAFYLRFYSPLAHILPVSEIPSWHYYRNALFLILPLWAFIFHENDLYKTHFVPIVDEFLRVVRTVSIGIFFFFMAMFFYRDYSFSRITTLIFWILAILSMFSYRAIFKLLAGSLTRKIFGSENVLIVGKENKMIKMLMKRHPNYQAYYHPYDTAVDSDKIKAQITEKGIDQVLLVHPEWTEQTLLEFYDWCEVNRIDLKLVPDIVQLCRGEIHIDSSLGIPIFHIKPASLSGLNFYIKRVIDVVIATSVLSLFWPVLALITVLIKIDSHGPALFKQKRMGYRGNIFNFYKFRTMVANADALIEKLKNMSSRKGPVFKMINDPRVTKIGSVLRKYSIDEIPQLINVLRGEMSIVGPRPQVLWEAAAYDDWSKRRLRVLPGITGLWQVSGRASLSYEEMIELDIYYIENWSVGLDLKILFKTFPAIVSQRGAY